ncbi:hypothetical protein E2C00_17885 [Streptomyces sp. WAC05374]|uniref:hypothetical protein n=1 Tax=Streptomyces sp. WAC05374 TaxID=2487420 RepID=UPI000F886E9F|nr:hypothetical protein [Streptomyces sp. WAC05374]RST17666.1 hypothetical protein EF905_08750 [Streptomyces sp. WAC05374]TDF54759.1 hypothetical protein E2C00_17885 [Streptomyces sp. WAC05374]TDF56395.1 hypothetical protein E2C02_13340 [Streptomyces sp. WAC05374]
MDTPRRCGKCGTELVVRRDTYREAFRDQLNLIAEMRSFPGIVLTTALGPVVRAWRGKRRYCPRCGWNRQVWR